MQTYCRASLRAAGLIRAFARRSLHSSVSHHAITRFAMPAMSPTMSEGGIAQWKKNEGESFSAGDVLLEIETDKATIDVEAQEDGILGKILRPDGSKNVAIGETIALIAEEGDDISNLELPESTPSASTSKAPEVGTKAEEKIVTPSNSVKESTQKSLSHEPSEKVSIRSSRPLLPSVHRLLVEHGIRNADDIKGTGLHGILTKGDILAYLGKIKSPLGTYRPPPSIFPSAASAKTEEKKPLDGHALRQLIVRRLAEPKPGTQVTPTPINFDSIIGDYLPLSTKGVPPMSSPLATKQDRSSLASYFDGLL